MDEGPRYDTSTMGVVREVKVTVRAYYAVGFVAVVAMGLASRSYPWIFPAMLGKYPGDALWAMMVFCGCGFVAPRSSTAKLAGYALSISYLDEFSQLYQAPWINGIRKTTMGHLILGSTFSWLDMLAYTVGVVMCAMVREILRRFPLRWTTFLVALSLFGQGQKSDTLTVNVPATANPYLAGMPNGTKAREGDKAPQQSPVLVERTLSHAVAITFTAVGAVEHTPACPPYCSGPNGANLGRHRGGAEHGISDIIAPMDALVGVFLDDGRPDRSKAPPGLDFRSFRADLATVSPPQLKQIFLIGNGRTSRGTPRRYLVPAKATRLYLGTMDGYEWNNNSGSFTVTVTIERDQVGTSMFAVDTSVSFAKWACLPDRPRCTPDRPVAEEKSPGEFHVIIPASSEWSISVPVPQGSGMIHAATGVVCLSTDRCGGPQGVGGAAGVGFLAPDQPAGALISKVIEGRIYFSVNHRVGVPFRDHEGYFEFDVSAR